MHRAALLALLLVSCGREPAPPSAPPAPAAPTEPAAPAIAATPAPTPPPSAPRAPSAAREPDWGEPDMAKVQKLFRTRFAEVKRCYESALVKDEGASGKLTLRFTILESGALANVSAARSTFAGREVPECVAEVVRRWKTPFRPAEPVDVEYPLRFSAR